MSKPQARKKRSLFAAGQGLVEYVLLLALVGGVAVGALALTGVSVRDAFGQIVAQLEGDATPEPPPEEITVTVVDFSGDGVANVRVHAFTSQGRYTGHTGRTDSAGQILFDLDDGDFKFRAYYQTHRYWSETVSWPAQTHAEIQTGRRPFEVKVTDAAGAGIAGVRVHAFNERGWYTGVYGNTGADGTVTLDLADGDFKFRAYYQAHYYWSGVVHSPDVTSTTIEVGRRPFEVKVTDAAGAGIAGVRVHAFNERGWYTGIYGSTGADGTVTLDLADGDFKFRAYYQAHYYWSGVVHSPDVTSTTIQTGRRPVTVRVVNQGGAPQAGVRVYAFNERGWYTGVYGNTGADGTVLLNLSDGTYRIRANTRNGAFWSDAMTTPGSTAVTVTVQ